MKKTIELLIIFFILLLASCVKEPNKVFFTKYYECVDPRNNLLEIYNSSNEKINLKDYKINIYKDGSSTPTYTHNLKGILKAKSFYVIKSISNFNQINADFSVDLRFTGDDAIELCKGSKRVDILGTVGTQQDFGVDVTLVKKLEYLKGYTKFVPYYYIPYKLNFTEILRSFDYITENELLQGPKLTDIDYNKTFKKAETLGGGGVITVTLESFVDGDTARFNYPSNLGIKNGEKVRFFNINTKETMPDLTQEWGLPAKYYTKKMLESASKIELQSIENGNLRETFGRLLGNVWVDGKLLNYLIVKKGYSDVAFGNNDLLYKNITYTNWLKDANNYAIFNKLGLHGQKDPYWDYNLGKPL